MTTSSLLNTYLSQATAAQAQRRLVWRMVTALETTFNIPLGDQLVFVLGDGSEQDNRHALYTWVTQELQRTVSESAVHLLHQLTDRLHRALTDWESDRYEA